MLACALSSVSCRSLDVLDYCMISTLHILGQMFSLPLIYGVVCVVLFDIPRYQLRELRLRCGLYVRNCFYGIDSLEQAGT